MKLTDKSRIEILAMVEDLLSEINLLVQELERRDKNPRNKGRRKT